MPLYTFASDAIAALINVTHHEKSAFCNNLTAELFLVQELIQSGQNAEDAKSEDRLRALLRNLERLCKWPQRLSSKSTTTSQPRDLGFPALKKLIQDQRSASVSIRLFATSNDAAARDQRKELLQMLKKFNKMSSGTSAGDSSQSQSDLRSVLTVGDDHHLAVLTLYETLSAHCFCHQTRIDTKIRLREERIKQMQVPAFNVLFLAHPHQEGDDHVAPFWQNTRIGVVSGHDYSYSSQLSLTGLIRHGDLCNRISSGRQLQLSFLLFDRNLHLDEWCEGEKSWIANINSISLTTILMNHKLNQRGRYLLSFFLARAVCTYYGSDWMRHPWTKENIHFMFERRGSVSGVFLNEPFVSAYFHPSSLAANQASNLLSFSEIYALGIILLELELGSTIEKEMLDFPECFAPDRSPVIDADLYTAIKLHEDLYRMEDTHRLLYEVIGICLRPTVLKPYATEMTGFRHAIHKYIVSPLQELIAGSYVEDDPEKVRVSRPTVELDTSLASRGVLSPRHISRSTSPGANQTFPPYPQNPSPAKISRHDSLDNLSSSLSRFSSLCLETEVVNYTHSDYTVGWICALPIEMAACTAMLDKLHPSLHIGSQDNNNYSLGKIGTHNVVIACLPSGVYGTTSAATVAMDMMYSFPSIRHRFMVGIGGGIPSKKNDIRLGDVVVSKPSNTTSGVFQHDMGKILHGSHTKFIGTLNKPPHPLLTAISTLQSRHFLTKSKVCSYLDDMKSRLGSSWCNFMPPNRTTDRLFRSDFAHDESNDTCSKCAATEEQTRPIRSSDHPQIYYGPIVSGNSVVRDSYTRDRLGEQGFLAFEMEAAGLMDRFPCLVIRGICDYSDSHKNKEWQGYAAAAAAAFAKEVLSVIHES